MGIQAATAAGMASVRVPPPLERTQWNRTPGCGSVDNRRQTPRRSACLPPTLRRSARRAGRRIDFAILVAIAAAVALLHLLTNSALRLSSRRTAIPQRCAPSRLGLCRLSPFTPFVERIGLASSASRWSACGSSRCWRRPRPSSSPDSWHGSSAARGWRRSQRRWPSLSRRCRSLRARSSSTLHSISVVGAGRIFHDSPAQVGQSPLVAGNRSGPGAGAAHQICSHLLHRRNPAGIVFTFAPQVPRIVVLGWRSPGAADLSAQSHLALPPRLHLVPVSPAYSHARPRRGPCERVSHYQFLVCANLFAAPVWLIGLLVPARSPLSDAGVDVSRSARVFWIGKGRDYYIAGAYPMLLAMGAVMCERWLASLPRWGRRTVEAVYFAAFAVIAALCLRRSFCRLHRAALSATSPCSQRRSARGDRLGRVGPNRRADPRFAAG